MVKIILEAGADANYSGGFNGNVHQQAAMQNVDIVNYRSALQSATLEGNIEIVKILLDAGADVNTLGGKYGSALQSAAFNGNIETVEILLDVGADVNTLGGKYGSALQSAAFSGNIEIVKFLLDAGADVNTSGGTYGSVFQAAVAGVMDLFSYNSQDKSKSKEIVKTLIKEGADCNTLGGNYGSVLQAAVVGVTHWKYLIKWLLEKESGVILQSRAIDGSSLLHAAVASGDQDVLNDVCNAGAKNLINVKNNLGQTPMHLAVMSDNLQILELLCSFSADSNLIFEEIDLDGRTCLCLAVEIEAVETVKWLLDRGVKADSRDFGDSTPFQQAFQLENFQILSLLFPKTAEGRSASQWRAVRPQDSGPVIMITNGELATIKMISEGELRDYADERSYVLGHGFLECRLGLPVFPGTDKEKLPKTLRKSFQKLTKLHAVVWIMVKRKTSANEPNTERPALRTTVYFSTLEYAALPNTPTDLFDPLTKQLEEEWEEVCASADKHLDFMRTKVLESNSKLTKSLLRDARLWGVLTKLFEEQIAVLRSLAESFEDTRSTVLREESGDELYRKIRAFENEIGRLTSKVRKWLGNLNATSQALIQLQFNLTSIAEAQRSTSMNRSVKRLSWITFIFLPLMFIGTLFGMNVDILQSNPHWWLYLLFATGTTTLTLIVWIAFKRNENLEDGIEDKFRWLVKDMNQNVKEAYDDDAEDEYELENVITAETRILKKKPRWSGILQRPVYKKTRDLEGGEDDAEGNSEKKSKWARIWKLKRS